MSLFPLKESDKDSFDGRIHACPLRGRSTGFQLVDELGNGKPYAGLMYVITDLEDATYTGKLDATGSGKVDNHYCGPVVLKLSQPYQGSEKIYTALTGREHYPLPITELQVRAEKTRFFNKSGARTETNPTKNESNTFHQVEVRDLVDHSAHLPSPAQRRFAPDTKLFSLFRPESSVRGAKTQATSVEGGQSMASTSNESAMAILGFGPPVGHPKGVALLPNRHTVLEVRPLRALRPMVSPSADFCALNLYQLALMSTLSYSDFAQQPGISPVNTGSVSFPLQPSIGNWFGDALPKFEELWQVDAAQAGGQAYYPLYEEVPYSKRLEVVPFDPELYPQANSPSLKEKQENPATVHSLDDCASKNGTDTQAFITHHDSLILLSIRGTAGNKDVLRDMNATQVPFEEGVGKVHSGFYGAAKVAYDFAVRYLDKFYSGQKLVITGHSLGGAIALIVSEMLRRRPEKYDVMLYTYGAPRAGDSVFVEGAKPLTHHRIVNHNDPVPSVPSTWMNTSTSRAYLAQIVATVATPPVGVSWFALGMVNIKGEPYTHHGSLRHFMPVYFNAGVKSSILWQPGCSTIDDHGCAAAIQATNGLPERGPFLRQGIDNADHKMVASYIPNCWATLRRWQEAQKSKQSLLTADEFNQVDQALKSVRQQLAAWDRRLAASPDHYKDRQVAAMASLRQEARNLDTARQRLGTLRFAPIKSADVYGTFADSPALTEEHLPRWEAHADNQRQVQLAMVPPAADANERAIAALTGSPMIGDPWTLDIDSIV